MPGAGKTTIGRLLSNKTNRKFIDTDNIIEERENKSIDNIFKLKGENYFRQKERTIVLEIQNKENLVVATGGGLPIYNDNLELLNNSDITIFINTDIKEIEKRLKNQIHNRPKLKDDLVGNLNKMYNERISTYLKAKICIEVKENHLVEEVVDIIINRLKEYKQYNK